MNEQQCDDYVKCVLDYDKKLGDEIERNLDDICDLYSINKEDIKKSQNKYINNSNSHKLLGREEVINAKIPQGLTPLKALDIEREMESFAFQQQKFFVEYFRRQA